MPLKQSEIKEKLDAWAKVQAKLSKLTAKRNAALDPFIKEHHERIAPILERFDAAADPLIVESFELNREITAALNANVGKDGKPKPVIVTAQNATAQISISEGARVVSVQKFFDAVKDKTASFWDCLAVGVGKAEKLVGKVKLDEISDKKTTYPVAISLNK